MRQREHEIMNAITLRFLASPSTVNFGGKVHGGTVMKWIDEAAYACATAFSQRYCVTAFVGGIRFLRPIVIGDLVEVEATLAYTGTKSINIAVTVRSGDLKEMKLEQTAECAVVFVAVDSHGNSVAVTPFALVGVKAQARAQRVQGLLGRMTSEVKPLTDSG
jgi:acyl-CoA hydrolase